MLLRRAAAAAAAAKRSSSLTPARALRHVGAAGRDHATTTTSSSPPRRHGHLLAPLAESEPLTATVSPRPFPDYRPPRPDSPEHDALARRLVAAVLASPHPASLPPLPFLPLLHPIHLLLALPLLASHPRLLSRSYWPTRRGQSTIEVWFLYEKSNGLLPTSMESVIEKYHEAKDHHSMMSATAEAKLWQREAGILRQQLHNLQEHHLQLLGQRLSGLDVKDLQNLESTMETSLRNIRLKKDQLMTDQIQELNRKGSLVRQENIELYNKFNYVHQENTKLKKKVYGGVTEHLTDTFIKYSVVNKEDENVPVNLELSQP
ncbi:MADS-box transcription factor 27 [Dichanthelium oligosanthes]|uniref:MADS-box transcription factor 27 n=1 Tax=Dichanthelium oligosanthes TaxID=888268 RepID=A0A1E5VGL8_9POAL|nr:MADS-box transcription factor 27 [Dichanthelium oligosanthes]